MNAQVASFSTVDTTYGMVIDIDSGTATNCLCPDRQYRGRECKHMRRFNSEVQRAAAFLVMVRHIEEMEARQHQEAATAALCYRDMQTDPRFQ